MQTIYSGSSIGNKPRFIFAISTLLAFTLVACDRTASPDGPAIKAAQPVAETTTFETIRLGATIESFEKAPTLENQSSVELAFAKLDGEIAELKDRTVKTSGSDHADAAAKLDNLQRYRHAEMTRFAVARNAMPSGLNPSPDSRSAVQKTEDAVAKAGEKVGDGIKKVGRTFKKAADKTGEAIEDATD